MQCFVFEFKKQNLKGKKKTRYENNWKIWIQSVPSTGNVGSFTVP